ncbi:hypothetical protein PsYK624_040330 [Phanerochaete sordida]|uniref:F-box domain-containing protein n=1 Tax=Phanerochaete sordida TaxID=48140 RepID=A0A9P3G4Z8_9APHY|nr:hypothetical protein PsYK624_040330 [Phanerochaete sordida]
MANLDELTALVALAWPTAGTDSDREDQTSDEDACRSACDAELADIRNIHDKVAAAAIRLRLERNKHVAVNTLPVELLRQIFCCAGEHGLLYKTNFAIIATCARWRAVALEEPLMWTHLPLCNLKDEALEFYLDHTRTQYTQHPCTATIRRYWPKSLDNGDLVDCVETLRAFFPCVQDFDNGEWEYNKLCTRGFRRLEIHIKEAHFMNILSEWLFFSGHEVHYMTVSGGRFRWDCRAYQDLLELDLTARALENHEMASQEGSLLQVFRGSPQLQKLRFRLYDVEQPDFDPEDDPGLSEKIQSEHIPMDHLRSLILDLPVAFATHILQSISLPYDTMTLFDLTVRSPGPADALGDVLRSMPPAALFSELQELRVYDRLQHGLGLRGTGARAHSGSPYIVVLAAKDLVSASSHDPRSLGFPALSAHIPEMPHLVDVIFQVPNRISAVHPLSLTEESTRAMVSFVPGRTPRLRRVGFDGCQPVLLDALRERLTEAFGTSAAALSPPVHIEDIVVFNGTRKRLKDTIPAENLHGLAPLCRLLAEHGSPLRSLKIKCKMVDSRGLSVVEFLEQISEVGIPELRHLQ